MNADYLDDLLTAIPALGSVDRTTPLNKGFSPDAKFIAWEKDIPRYLIRLADVDRQELLHAEFEILVPCYNARIPCPEPVAFGITADEKACYLVVGYIQGEGADKTLGQYSADEQFQLGIVTGRVLRDMHDISPPRETTSVYRHHQSRYQHWVAETQKLGLAFYGQREVEAYIDRNMELLRQSPARLQHSDYHPAHLIILNGKFNGIIDFNRAEWTDPVRDFQRMPWFTCPISLAFARGQIEGYLSEGVPAHFWQRYNLFVALTLHRNAWAAHVKWPHNLDLWNRKIEEIVQTHDFANGEEPAWLSEDIELIQEQP